MPTPTYDLIEEQTPSGTGTVTFSNIPGTYKDLVLEFIVSYASLGANVGYLNIRMGNGSVDTGANYSTTYITGTGSAAQSSRSTGANKFNLDTNITGTNQYLGIVQFMSYANTNVRKTNLSRNNYTAGSVKAEVNLWASTSAINTISLFDENNYSFASGSVVRLWGVAG